MNSRETLSSKRKIRVLVVTYADPGKNFPQKPAIGKQLLALKEMGVEIDFLFVELSNKLSYFKTALKIFFLMFQKRRYDLIHAYYSLCGFLARLQFKYPVVVTFLGSDILSTDGKRRIISRDSVVGRLVARLVDVIIVRTEEMKRIAGRQDAYIIPSGVDVNIFIPYPKKQARHELGFPLDEKLILFPWKPDRPEKRYDIVQEAIQILNERFEKIRLVTIYNKPYEMVAKYMNACDVIALASNHEGSPMAIREALACHLPVVSVNVGDVAQLIAGIEVCYICERDSKDMAEKIEWVLKQNQRINCSQKVETMDVTWAAEKVLEVYKDVLIS